jgi:L-amino acid N-acyltransferase YncA
MMLISDTKAIAPWVASRTACAINDQMSAIAWKADNGDITCGVVYDHFTGKSITFTGAIDKGIVPKSFIEALLKYPFEQLGVDTMVAYVRETNVKSIRFLRRLGFEMAAAVNDVYRDGAMLIFTLPRTRYEQLGVHHG